ncbi:hypothetical protein GYA93_03045 [Gordonia desulfuricans]|uniref:Type IV toxin-antitoxin system AbiEi family antitoxin domain-containing protein n=1 Tax=Gordonia desulfuricans TaxID=89051 RepID=A0A7K3LJX6_9ACTN|nr:type IV toxin-antitoxin system AbiEi family antitoxin domain-containing protein [Gordonia desulfuricans]NDK88562.1 hypothetical protein [Gordonia desulfuricans]
MTTFPADTHGILLRREALASGITDNQLARAARSGQLVRIWTGAFVPRDRLPAKAVDLHRLRVRAAMDHSGADQVVSHQSAATLHGLEMLLPDLGRVHVTDGAARGGRIDAHKHAHNGALDAQEIVVVDGIRVTGLERTAVDVARSVGQFAPALSVCDSALRLGADREPMTQMLAGRGAGVNLARYALGLADPLSENPAESWGRAQMIAAGLPVPELQHAFHDDDGNLFARADYYWEGLVGEFDGFVKYEKLLGADQDASAVVVDEKIREDKIRRCGVVVVRWIWADLTANRVVGILTPELTRLGLI